MVKKIFTSDTYDVQDLIVNELSRGGGINVSVVFAGGSQSPGALVCVMPILTDGSLDFNNMTLSTIPRDRSESVDITVPTGTYRLFAFDLENNTYTLPRMPESRAADCETVNVTAENGKCACNCHVCSCKQHSLLLFVVQLLLPNI